MFHCLTSKPPAGGPFRDALQLHLNQHQQTPVTRLFRPVSLIFPSLWVTHFFDYPNKNSSQTKPNNTLFGSPRFKQTKKCGVLGTFQWAKFGRIGPPSYPDHLSIPKTKILQAAWGSCKPHSANWSQNAAPILCENTWWMATQLKHDQNHFFVGCC